MKAVRETIARVAPSDALGADHRRARHGQGGRRQPAAPAVRRARRKPLVTMNAGGLSEGVAESELFGHVKGAFTDARTDRIGCFELADEGTLFLDEIANMPVKLQPKLLRVLQTGEVQKVGSSRVIYVNVRVLSATNADLRAGDRRRPVPRGSAVPAEHRRDPPAGAARAARGHLAARRALSGAVPRQVPPSGRGLRPVGQAGARIAHLAGQRPRARPCGRARRS